MAIASVAATAPLPHVVEATSISAHLKVADEVKVLEEKESEKEWEEESSEDSISRDSQELILITC